MIVRSDNFKKFPLNICGSSSFGRYPKISVELTMNMFLSDGWLVDYAGYQSVNFGIVLGSMGRACFTSTKFGRLVVVIDANVYLLNIFYDQNIQETFDTSYQLIGTLATGEGVVYITENNVPQIVLSDGVNVYYYDPRLSPILLIAAKDTSGTPIDFIPGYVAFHDTYILCAAREDTGITGLPVNNTWRLGVPDTEAYASGGTGKLVFPNAPSGISYIGTLERKPDNTQAAIPFPSRGNMILVLGEIVGVPFFDVGTQKFPYEQDNKEHFDYGCLNPATVAYLDEIVVWLAQNEKSGPIIVYSKGGALEKITTDGIDYLFSQLTNPSDSQGFLYRQDGHLIYHINFYTDNLSLFYDFNTQKFFNACDEHGNYFIAAQVAFFNNQYYFVTKNNGNVYAFDTIFTTYDGAAIPRRRICASIRDPDQQFRICNDIGFTIQQGDNNPTSNGIANLVIVNGGMDYTGETNVNLVYEDGITRIELEDGSGDLLSQQSPINATEVIFVGGNGTGASATVTVTDGVITGITLTNPGSGYTYPPSIIIMDPTGSGAIITATLTNTSARVDLSISRDGGLTFENRVQYILNPTGYAENKLMWWNLGIGNDLVPMFEFISMGKFVAYNGEAWMRQ